MKKALVIVILVIYIASIAVVNFFGLEIGMFDGTTYVTSIQCDTLTLRREDGGELNPSQYKPDGTPIFMFPFIPSDTEEGYTTENIMSNPNAVEINYVVFPFDATESNVRYIYDEAATEKVAYFDESKKTLVFLKPNSMVTITLMSTDGSNISSKISIIGIPQS